MQCTQKTFFIYQYLMPTFQCLRSLSLLLLLLVLCSCTTTTKPSENLIVFVGKKLELLKLNSEGRDAKYKAKYQILEVIYGKYEDSEIEFDVYDHYGYPIFGHYDTVLLYVSKISFFQLLHEKYQFQPVFKTVDGKWAGCGDPYRFEPNVDRDIVARKIDFQPLEIAKIKKEVKDKRSVIHKKFGEDEFMKILYPTESFEYTKDAIICRMGTTPKELFEVKRNGILKARKIFP